MKGMIIFMKIQIMNLQKISYSHTQNYCEFKNFKEISGPKTKFHIQLKVCRLQISTNFSLPRRSNLN